MNEHFAYPVIDMKRTGENIRALRETNGMSAKELQEVLGFTSPQAIYKWQWGQTLPDLTNLLAMARLWNVAVEDILVLEHQDVSFLKLPGFWFLHLKSTGSRVSCASFIQWFPVLGVSGLNDLCHPYKVSVCPHQIRTLS